MTKRYKPRLDRLFYGIAIFTAAVVLGCLIPSFYGGGAFAIAVTLGFFLSREIPYEKIYAVEKKHMMVADSMLSLKNGMDHLNVKYNRFDLVSLSLQNEEDFIKVLCERCKITRP